MISIKLPINRLRAGLTLVDAFCISGLCSKSEAQRNILQGDAYINAHIIRHVRGVLTTGAMNSKRQILLSIGHKTAILEFEGDST